MSESERGGVEKSEVAIAGANSSRLFERSRLSQEKLPWGCIGFDVVIDRFGLRVRELCPLINEQIKINANNVVSMADYRAQRLAA